MTVAPPRPAKNKRLDKAEAPGSPPKPMEDCSTA
jgi:hypothetical protein